MDIYDHDREIRLDERQLSDKLGVSRTPIREALTLLEQEGFIRLQPRRGIFVVRKTKTEIVEMIQVWAALESMAARMARRRRSTSCGTCSAVSSSAARRTMSATVPTPTSPSTRASSN